MMLSLDGLVARPGRHGAGGWGLPPADPALKEKLAWFRDIGLHLMGRATYQEMAEFWPASNDGYAAPMNNIPKVVFSRTLERADWPESRIARGDLAAEITALKRDSNSLTPRLTAPARRSTSTAGRPEERWTTTDWIAGTRIIELLGRVLINRPAVSAFPATLTLSRRRRMTESDPNRTLRTWLFFSPKEGGPPSSFRFGHVLTDP